MYDLFMNYSHSTSLFQYVVNKKTIKLKGIILIHELEIYYLDINIESIYLKCSYYKEFFSCFFNNSMIFIFIFIRNDRSIFLTKKLMVRKIGKNL